MPTYQQHHAYYCGVDLHARSLFVHVCDPAGGATANDRANSWDLIPASPAAAQARPRCFGLGLPPDPGE